jgi:hypothetical protein
VVYKKNKIFPGPSKVFAGQVFLEVFNLLGDKKYAYKQQKKRGLHFG